MNFDANRMNAYITCKEGLFMIFETVIVGPLEVNCYLLGCEETRQGVVIDPGADADRIIPLISRHGLKIVHVINTHGHFDHVSGNRKMLEATGADLLLHEADVPLLSLAGATAAAYGLKAEDSPFPDGYLSDGMNIAFGNYELTVLHTPGHTQGGCCLYCEGLVITGDTLFADSVGRTDLPGGSHAALLESIHRKLLTLPDGTVAYPGMAGSTDGRERSQIPICKTGVDFMGENFEGCSMLKGKEIVLGVTGGIAAYNAVELLRLLSGAGANVHVIMTRAAMEFVAPLTVQTLSMNPVHTDLFNLIAEQEIGHIALADRAHLLVIAPATANCIGKLASGIADNLLTTTVRTRPCTLPRHECQHVSKSPVSGKCRKAAAARLHVR
jgi:glyoxylase-like metal-dependent hydrolase (beta-lactamase superfamily II)